LIYPTSIGGITTPQKHKCVRGGRIKINTVKVIKNKKLLQCLLGGYMCLTIHSKDSARKRIVHTSEYNEPRTKEHVEDFR